MSNNIPFVDLHAQYLGIKNDIDAVIAEVIEKSMFVRGPYVDKFEKAFAELMQSKHCVSCANGTDSLYIAMFALGVKPGDEVIAPAHSWISTTETITQAGGTVVFCDTDAQTYTMDPRSLESKITSKTVGIIPVHLYGQAADMDPIMEIARKHKLWVLEDCAQAHLAQYKGKQVGTFGDAASYSFYPGKNLGAMGDAGAVTTNDSALADKMAMFARHGGLTKGDHQIEGINSRLDGLQAAILSVKLPHLPKWTAQRQERAARYTKLLADVPSIKVPHIAEGREPVWHLYVIEHERRDELAKYLGAKGIPTVINYPVALPFLPAYQRLGHTPADFPNAYANQSRILSIPIFPELTDAQMDIVVAAIKAFDEGK
ncbi:DegT/DnrJ/EryC1/StrS family aminotransferase [Pandoraea commovens]|uniref:DegT/DnrJ/EryC1/StrS family aminotransferase n=1 Tax=Pandoraea commovens TaxID=2508289 RepID=A0A5E4THL8_9BURK|nr:DegT/DnrJ/EryC1/StrS family aminotransferase [Pandoraea commovens]UVA79344.1 DegT/DnrJ/EryC1/StrS family aminotransferase [Pandoraea commovens]VVD85689.1 erythromycin biosynthesis sensory transduction protein eryC1 [Pandoraea commovens]